MVPNGSHKRNWQLTMQLGSHIVSDSLPTTAYEGRLPNPASSLKVRVNATGKYSFVYSRKGKQET